MTENPQHAHSSESSGSVGKLYWGESSPVFAVGSIEIPLGKVVLWRHTFRCTI